MTTTALKRSVDFHEDSVGKSDEWYTPRNYFDAIGLTFDLDPCSPGPQHWAPAREIFTKSDDGLAQPWPPGALVFMNPPFGGPRGHVPWLVKFFDHGNGIAVIRAYTSSHWWHDHVAARAETILFPRGKTKFVRGEAMQSVSRDGAVTEHAAGSIGDKPGHGIALIGVGAVANSALKACGLGQLLLNNPVCTQAERHDLFSRAAE